MSTDSGYGGWLDDVLVGGLTPRQIKKALKKVSPKVFQKVELECAVHRGLYKAHVCGSCEDKEHVCLMCFRDKHSGHVCNMVPSVVTHNLRSSNEDKKEVKSFSCVTSLV